MKIKGKKVPNQIGGILSKKPWRGYRHGGTVDDELYDPSHGGTMPRSLQYPFPSPPDSWRRPPPQRRADGGEVDPLTLGLANPSFDERWLDRAGAAHLGQRPEMLKSLFRAGNASPNKPPERDYSNLGLFGEMRGTAPEDTPTAIQTKNPMMAITEGDIERGMNVGMGAGPGIMVGKYGAHMLRQQAREAGRATQPHPVYADKVEPAAQRLRPEFRDAYRGWQQDARDAQARGILEMRGPQGSNNPYDADIWQGAGWFRGAEGVPTKEIPDIGAKLVKIPGTNKYALDHPAGDFHKIYDIPPIEFDPKIPKGDGYMEIDTNKIVLGGKPTKTNLKEAVSPALHEVNHVAQKYEGFPGGSNPMNSLERPELAQEYFPKTGSAEDAMGPLTIMDNIMGVAARSPWKAHVPSWQQEMVERQTQRGKNPEEGKPSLDRGAFSVYKRASGETASRNVQDRRAKSYRYGVHPAHTEDVPRGLQWTDTKPPRARKDIKIYPSRDEAMKAGWEHDSNPAHYMPSPKKADGGEVESNAPWFTKASARPSSGMLKSTIPGRTDKIPLKVGGGSYVLPADIPSALGQGNTMAGSTILDKMFTRGPYGMNLPKAKAGQSTKMSRMSSLTKTRVKTGYAEGGETTETPIIAAGGEYILSPDQVLQVGGGDMKRGHDILDQFVLGVRKEHIKTLKGLRPPKKD